MLDCRCRYSKSSHHGENRTADCETPRREATSFVTRPSLTSLHRTRPVARIEPTTHHRYLRSRLCPAEQNIDLKSDHRLGSRVSSALGSGPVALRRTKRSLAQQAGTLLSRHHPARQRLPCKIERYRRTAGNFHLTNL